MAAPGPRRVVARHREQFLSRVRKALVKLLETGAGAGRPGRPLMADRRAASTAPQSGGRPMSVRAATSGTENLARTGPPPHSARPSIRSAPASGRPFTARPTDRKSC